MKARHLKNVASDRSNYKEKRNSLNFPTTGMGGNGLCTDYVKPLDRVAAAKRHNVKTFVKNDSNARNGAIVITSRSKVEMDLAARAAQFRKEAKKAARAAKKEQIALAEANAKYHNRNVDCLPTGGGLRPPEWTDRMNDKL